MTVIEGMSSEGDSAPDWSPLGSPLMPLMLLAALNGCDLHGLLAVAFGFISVLQPLKNWIETYIPRAPASIARCLTRAKYAGLSCVTSNLGPPSSAVSGPVLM